MARVGVGVGEWYLDLGLDWYWEEGRVGAAVGAGQAVAARCDASCAGSGRSLREAFGVARVIRTLVQASVLQRCFMLFKVRRQEGRRQEHSRSREKWQAEYMRRDSRSDDSSETCRTRVARVPPVSLTSIQLSTRRRRRPKLDVPVSAQALANHPVSRSTGQRLAEVLTSVTVT